MLYGSFYLNAIGNHDLAEAEVRFCMELDPLNIAAGLELAWVYFVGRKYNEAIHQLQSALEVDPNYPMAVALLGLSFEQVDAFDDAVESLEKAVALSQGSPFFLALLARGYAAAGRREEAVEILDDLSTNWSRAYATPYYMAAAYAALDDEDAAFEWLERAYDVRDSWLVFANEDPVLDALRPDPRFHDLLQRLNFPEQS
jgi:tetratricopeptide (TPR) repeat protein